MELSNWHKVEGIFEGDHLYRANRWVSDLLNVGVVLYPTALDKPLIEIDAQLEECSLEDVRQVIRELTEWVETLESGEFYPEYRGFDPVARWHYQGERSDTTLCGVPWEGLKAKKSPKTQCPNCHEIFSEKG